MGPIDKGSRFAAAASASRVSRSPRFAALPSEDFRADTAAIHGLPQHCARQQYSCPTTLVAAVGAYDGWPALELSADSHNCRVESYLQRRRHRPWRNRGS